MSFISLADFKTYAGITTTDKDVFLQMQLDIVCDAVEAFCRRKFSPTTYTQQFFADDYRNYPSRYLMLYQYPVKEVVSIIEGTNALTSFRLSKETGTLVRTDGLWLYDCDSDLTVVYKAGFDTIPAPVRGSVYNLVLANYNKDKAGVALSFGSDVQRVSIPGTISIDFDYTLTNNDRSTPFGEILGNELNVLDYYRSERAILGSGRLAYVAS